MFPSGEKPAAGEKEGRPQDDQRARREMLRGQQTHAVKGDPDQRQVDGAMDHQREHTSREKGGRQAEEGALHSGGDERFAATDGPAGEEKEVGQSGQGQNGQPHDKKLVR